MFFNCLLNIFSGDSNPFAKTYHGEHGDKETPKPKLLFPDGKALKLPKYYSNGMVFQRGPAKHNVWGFTKDHKTELWITETCDGREVEAKAVNFEYSLQV